MLAALATGTEDDVVDASTPLDEAAAAAAAVTWKAAVGLLLLLAFEVVNDNDDLFKFKAAKPLVVLTMVDTVGTSAAFAVTAFVVLGTAVAVDNSSLARGTEEAAAGEVGVSGSAPPTTPLSSASSVLVDLSAVEHFITGFTLLLLLMLAMAAAR